MEKTKRPPVGAIPRSMWELNRLFDLMCAIDRYHQAGIQEPLPEWIEERDELALKLWGDQKLAVLGFEIHTVKRTEGYFLRFTTGEFEEQRNRAAQFPTLNPNTIEILDDIDFIEMFPNATNEVHRHFIKLRYKEELERLKEEGIETRTYPNFEMRSVDGGGCIVRYYRKGPDDWSETYFSNPPSSIDHVGIDYLQGRLPNVIDSSDEEFVKKYFKQMYKYLFGADEDE